MTATEARHSLFASLAALLVAAPMSPASAQPAVATVRGVAYDSLSGRPLADAFVTLDGLRSATTDASGRFRFDSVALGRRVLAVQHETLDALGVSGLTVAAAVTQDQAEIHIATPSFNTLWRTRCGSDRAPRDSGFVYGTIVDVVGTPVANATVTLEWIQLGSAGKRGIVQRQWQGEAQSAANGGYGICGVPVDAGLRIQARTDSASSGSVDLPPEHARVLRRDLRVAPYAGAAGALRGTIAGVVTDSGGHPVPNARVVLEDANEIRAGDDGRFLLRDVPTGTRQIEVMGIGMTPVTAVADVGANDTAFVTVRLRRLTRLEVMRVTASARTRHIVSQFEERRRIAMGQFRDSLLIGTRETLSTVFAEMPGLYLERPQGTSASDFALSMRSPKGQRCAPTVWIDGALTDTRHLSMLRPPEIATIEAYPHAFSVPAELVAAGGDRLCGAIAVWTKFFFR